jgi:hypothetical protein
VSVRSEQLNDPARAAAGALRRAARSPGRWGHSRRAASAPGNSWLVLAVDLPFSMPPHCSKDKSRAAAAATAFMAAMANEPCAPSGTAVGYGNRRWIAGGETAAVFFSSDGAAICAMNARSTTSHRRGVPGRARAVAGKAPAPPLMPRPE